MFQLIKQFQETERMTGNLHRGINNGWSPFIYILEKYFQLLSLQVIKEHNQVQRKIHLEKLLIVVENILEQWPDKDTLDSNGNNYLHIVSGNFCIPQILELLQEKSHDLINHINHNGLTPFHCALHNYFETIDDLKNDGKTSHLNEMAYQGILVLSSYIDFKDNQYWLNGYCVPLRLILNTMKTNILPKTSLRHLNNICGLLLNNIYKEIHYSNTIINNFVEEPMVDAFVKRLILSKINPAAPGFYRYLFVLIQQNFNIGIGILENTPKLNLGALLNIREKDDDRNLIQIILCDFETYKYDEKYFLVIANLTNPQNSTISPTHVNAITNDKTPISMIYALEEPNIAFSYGTIYNLINCGAALFPFSQFITLFQHKLPLARHHQFDRSGSYLCHILLWLRAGFPVTSLRKVQRSGLISGIVKILFILFEEEDYSILEHILREFFPEKSIKFLLKKQNDDTLQVKLLEIDRNLKIQPTCLVTWAAAKAREYIAQKCVASNVIYAAQNLFDPPLPRRIVNLILCKHLQNSFHRYVCSDYQKYLKYGN